MANRQLLLQALLSCMVRLLPLPTKDQTHLSKIVIRIPCKDVNSYNLPINPLVVKWGAGKHLAQRGLHLSLEACKQVYSSDPLTEWTVIKVYTLPSTPNPGTSVIATI